MSTSTSLAGRVALVTGAASGIGRATTEAFAAAGAAVAVVDIDEAGAKAAAQSASSHGVRSEPFLLDLSQTDAIGPCVEAVVSAFGRIDYLVNSAGIIDHGMTLLELDDRVWEKVYRINVKAPLHFTHHVARHMVARGGGGRIVNVSSSSAFRALLSFPAYGSSKAALNQLTRSAAGELGPHDINVNAVVPGVTATPLATALPGLPELGSLAKSGPLANLLGRVSEPEDVSGVILFLCGPDSRQITGQMIHTSAGAVV